MNKAPAGKNIVNDCHLPWSMPAIWSNQPATKIIAMDKAARIHPTNFESRNVFILSSNQFPGTYIDNPEFGFRSTLNRNKLQPLFN
jgi:hypothetical protein